jgi:hypothetical protein
MRINPAQKPAQGPASDRERSAKLRSRAGVAVRRSAPTRRCPHICLRKLRGASIAFRSPSIAIFWNLSRRAGAFQQSDRNNHTGDRRQIPEAVGETANRPRHTYANRQHRRAGKPNQDCRHRTHRRLGFPSRPVDLVMARKEAVALDLWAAATASTQAAGQVGGHGDRRSLQSPMQQSSPSRKGRILPIRPRRPLTAQGGSVRHRPARQRA